MSHIKREVLTTAAAASTGGAIGAGVIQASGMTAAGMVGCCGAGIGSPAGPVGMAFGAVSGVAILTIVRTGQAVSREPKVRNAASSAAKQSRQRFDKTRRKVGRWISGDPQEQQS